MEQEEETATIDCTRLLLLTVSLSSNLLQAVRIGEKIITFHRGRALDTTNSVIRLVSSNLLSTV